MSTTRRFLSRNYDVYAIIPDAVDASRKVTLQIGVATRDVKGDIAVELGLYPRVGTIILKLRANAPTAQPTKKRAAA